MRTQPLQTISLINIMASTCSAIFVDHVVMEERCKCGNLTAQVLIGRLREILAMLEAEVENKNKEVSEIKDRHEKELAVKDQVIERLVKANQVLSEENAKIKCGMAKQKQRTFTTAASNLYEGDRSKGNFSDLLSFDSSYRHQTQILDESKLYGKIIKNTHSKHPNKHAKSALSLFDLQPPHTAKKTHLGQFYQQQTLHKNVPTNKKKNLDCFDFAEGSKQRTIKFTHLSPRNISSPYAQFYRPRVSGPRTKMLDLRNNTLQQIY